MQPNRTPLPAWQWNQYLITLASFTTFSGFTFFSPFIPLFVHSELGIESLAEVAFWSGVLIAAPPLLSALSAPFWGSLADRYGYRAMVQRAILTFVVVVGLMAFVTNIWQMLILRMLSGLLGGFNAMGMALITNVTPKTKTAQAVGLFQGARTFSNAFGPLLGGVLSAWIGMRPTFIVSAALFVGAFIMLRLFWRDEVEETSGARSTSRSTVSLWNAVRTPAFFAVMIALFLTQAVDQSFGPILPLVVQQMQPSDTASATLWTGLIVSVAAVGATISAMAAGRLATKFQPRSVLLFTLLAGAAVCVPLAAAMTTPGLLFWRALLGLLAGGSATLAYTVGGTHLPDELRGSGFGLLTSAALLGGAVSPLVYGVIAGVDLRLPFTLNSLVYVAVFAWVLVALRSRRTLAHPG
ncbi:MAG: MFS transporter [Chloroflexi bacterium]|nr:MFS transporter [Chloroflexota bacterium]